MKAGCGEVLGMICETHAPGGTPDSELRLRCPPEKRSGEKCDEQAGRRKAVFHRFQLMADSVSTRLDREADLRHVGTGDQRRLRATLG